MPKKNLATKRRKKIRVSKPAKSRKFLSVKHKDKTKKVAKLIKARKKVIVVSKKKNIAKKIAKKPLAHKIVGIKKIAKHITLKKVSTHKKKKKNIVPPVIFSAESLFKAKIKVIGIGGGGGSIVSEIGRSLEKATFVIADTDIRALKKKSGIKYFWFGEELTHGLGTGVNVDLAKQAAEAAKEKISGFFKDQDIIIFVASLGGGLGSGATQVFAEAAREFGGITLGIFTMPFKFEGKNKFRIAQNALKSLRKSLNVSLVIPNEKIFKIIDESTPITNAFSIVNKSLIGSLESLIDLIYNPGIINIDFADLRTVLRGRGNSAFLNTIEESGKDRIEKTCQNIFKNPLLQNSGFKAEKILFNIVGSENLSMFDVEKISSHISSLNPNAKIIFGISKDTKLKNKIKTTILMTGGEIEEKEEKIAVTEKVEPTKIFVKKESKKAVEKKVITGEKTENETNESTHKKIKSKKAKKQTTKVEITKNNVQKPSFERPFGLPFIETSDVLTPVVEQKRMEIIQIPDSGKKTIRRSGLEIRKAEELQEKKKIAQEKEWEIPAFLRKVKFKS